MLDTLMRVVEVSGTVTEQQWRDSANAGYALLVDPDEIRAVVTARATDVLGRDLSPPMRSVLTAVADVEPVAQRSAWWRSTLYVIGTGDLDLLGDIPPRG